jgi:hypothetical protein
MSNKITLTKKATNLNMPPYNGWVYKHQECPTFYMCVAGVPDKCPWMLVCLNSGYVYRTGKNPESLDVSDMELVAKHSEIQIKGVNPCNT